MTAIRIFGGGKTGHAEELAEGFGIGGPGAAWDRLLGLHIRWRADKICSDPRMVHYDWSKGEYGPRGGVSSLVHLDAGKRLDYTIVEPGEGLVPLEKGRASSVREREHRTRTMQGRTLRRTLITIPPSGPTGGSSSVCGTVRPAPRCWDPRMTWALISTSAGFQTPPISPARRRRHAASTCSCTTGSRRWQSAVPTRWSPSGTDVSTSPRLPRPWKDSGRSPPATWAIPLTRRLYLERLRQAGQNRVDHRLLERRNTLRA